MKFAKRERIEDFIQKNAVQRAQHGLIDADLGGGMVKKMRSNGVGRNVRILIAFRNGDRALFISGFGKDQQPNPDRKVFESIRKNAKKYLSLSDEQLESLIKEREIVEIQNE